MTTADSAWPRYPLAELNAFVFGLFSATGMDKDKAEAVAASLIAAESMGHSTHGLALASWYLEAARSGVMAT
jgi:LDH2 family malate/lactate/ureidoglycolate dehydrogenase